MLLLELVLKRQYYNIMGKITYTRKYINGDL
jgi:hypothetical protein